MMKELKDYLHLYLGCEVMYKDKKYSFRGFSKPYLTNDTAFADMVELFEPNKGFRSSISTTEINYIKPMLRQLQDMADKEKDEFEVYQMELMKQDLNQTERNSFKTLWYLKRQFDLFGLIASGLAIPNTKQTT